MPTKVNSGAVSGLDGVLVEVEADISPALPHTIIVGLPDMAVREARVRVKSAIKNSGWRFPQGRVAINLAPADLRKSGSIYDLPIAVAVLVEAGLVSTPPSSLQKSLFVGELALDGQLRPAIGVLAIALAAKDLGYQKIFLPIANAAEAALVKGLEVLPAESLRQVTEHLENLHAIEPFACSKKITAPPKHEPDFADISGQEAAKRVLTIAAAGGHNVLFTGPPGTGKTMLARALQGILPPLSESEHIEITKIYSAAGLLNKNTIVNSRPFRAPHHSSSQTALIGGGGQPKPGEITLAHRGVLFLDELPEFNRQAVESLRQPLEDGRITVTRLTSKSMFPADFILIAAQNPCPCGYFGSSQQSCLCNDGQIQRYRNRISGPMLDRIDLIVQVNQQKYAQLQKSGAQTSQQLQEQVIAARTLQLSRASKLNGRLKPVEIKRHCKLEAKANKVLSEAADKLHLSARACHRLIKTARTIADLEGEQDIKASHISEALQYRLR